MEKYRKIYQDLFYKIKTGEIPLNTKLPTEKELAEQYGVSVITVKAALNLLKNDGLIVQKKRLGSVVVNGIAANCTQLPLIAIVFSGFDHLDLRITNGLKKIAKEKNILVSFFDSGFDTQKEREILQYLLSENIAGLILMPISQRGNIDVLSMFAIQKIPVVFMDFPAYALDVPTVSSDNFDGMYNAVKYLIDCGHRYIGFFPFSDRLCPTEQDRFSGYCRALTDNGIPVSKDYLFSSYKYTYSVMEAITKTNMECAEEFFAKYNSLSLKPTAVVCVNDLCAFALIETGKKYGIKVPEHLSLIGFDNLSASVKSNLTTVSQNFSEIAQTALSTLLRKIQENGTLPPFFHIKLKTVLVRRDTVRKI